MEEKKRSLTIARVADTVNPPPEVTEPERQYGGPQSGLPPAFIVGSELAPYLIVGLDFGAHFCRVSTFVDGGPRPLNPHQYRALVEDALNVETDDGELVHSLKHCIAWNHSVRYDDKTFSAQEVATKFLLGIKERIERCAARLLAKAVIAVPSCFTHNQREMLINSATGAGISVLALVNEPTAATLDACFTNNLTNGKYLVLSSGAYTFEAAVVHLQNRLIEVKATRGSRKISGLATTLALVEAVKESFSGCDPGALHVAVERAKPQLNKGASVVIELPGRRAEFKRSELESHLSDYFECFKELIEQVLKDAMTERRDLTGVILTGQATNFWMLQDLLKENYHMAKIYTGNTAQGAATYAGLLTRQIKDWVVWDALSVPIVVAQGSHLKEVISAQSPVPINGHALLAPGEDGTTTASILQRVSDLDDDVVLVANVRIVEELEHVESGSSVDLSVAATADGVLSFSARHKILDVNLTVEVTEPDLPGPLIDLTQRSETETAPAEWFGSGIQIGWDGGRWFVLSVDERAQTSKPINVYDVLISIDDTVVGDLQDNVPEHLLGKSNQRRSLVLSRNGHLFRVKVACVIPYGATTVDQFKQAIADATLDNDIEQLI
ncbi:MAG TPA: Hsp70 family protein, partial [Chroococcales cyanobacterium]